MEGFTVLDSLPSLRSLDYLAKASFEAGLREQGPSEQRSPRRDYKGATEENHRCNHSFCFS